MNSIKRRNFYQGTVLESVLNPNIELKTLQVSRTKNPEETQVELVGNLCGFVENLYFCDRQFFSVRPSNKEENSIKDIIFDHKDIELERTFLVKTSQFEDMKKIHKTEEIEGINIFFFEKEENSDFLTHYFHFIEHILGIWTSLKIKNINPNSIKNICFIGGKKSIKKWQGKNDINKHILSALFPNASVKNGFKLNSNIVYKFLTSFISDRENSINLPKEYKDNIGKLNKHLSIMATHIVPEYIEEIRNKLLNYFEIKIKTNKTHTITYAKRVKTKRRFSKEIEKNLLKSLKEKFPKSKIIISNFTKLSFKEQIEIIANTDLLIGIHGNGLTHSIFMTPNKTIIEIFPENTHHLDYRMLAELNNLRYYCFDEKSGLISKEKSYSIGAFGDPNKIIKNLNIEFLEDIS